MKLSKLVKSLTLFILAMFAIALPTSYSLENKSSAEKAEVIYEIKQGDTLLALVARYFANDKALAEIIRINQIKNPDKIPVGQKITFPRDLLVFAPSQARLTTLDSFDRISLGGVNGVRAYTSVDGIGDHGALFNIDLIQRMPHQQYFGIFYDVGVVQPFKNPQQGVLNNIYTLQGAGIQYGISYQRFSLNMNVAKALGTYEGYVPGNIESAPDNWRGNISASYSF